jgi:hypothetical protein
MDKRVNKLITGYVTNFKDGIRSKINELAFEEKSKINDLLEYVYDYERLVVQKDDMNKRKRIKNAIPELNRCNAKRCNGEQCTRRRKEGSEFCGTHAKGTPHGLIHEATDDSPETASYQVEVFAEEIFGIVYYIDTMGNVYKTEDIMSGKQNAAIIAKYVKSADGTYSIPQFGLA